MKSIIWFLVIFIFFSISKTKLPGYITPLSVPLNKIPAPFRKRDGVGMRSSADNGMRYSLALMIILSIIIAAGAGMLTPYVTNSEAILKQVHGHIVLGYGFYYIAVVIASAVILFLLALWRNKRGAAFGVMAGMVTVL